MADIVAIKRLTHTDLTLFDPYWQHHSATQRAAIRAWEAAGKPADDEPKKASGQKGINLNKALLAQIYPARAADPDGTRYPLSITLFGPGYAGPAVYPRPLIKQEKNWRLGGGATLKEQLGEAGRLAALALDDVALMRFAEDGPAGPMRMVVLAEAAGDGAVMAALARFIGSRNAGSATPSDLAAALSAAGIAGAHPVWSMVDDAAGTTAAAASVEGDERPLAALRKTRGRVGAGVTLDQYLRARAEAEATGRIGEQIAASWLGAACDRFEWISRDQELAPLDMMAGGGPIPDHVAALDIKSTKYGFDTPFKISAGELQAAAVSDIPYRIVRLSGARSEMPAAVVSECIRDWAKGVCRTLDRVLPSGVRADSFTVDPRAEGLDWGVIHDLSAHAASPAPEPVSDGEGGEDDDL